MWASCLVFVLSRGPGAFSLDYVLKRRFGRGIAAASYHEAPMG
jgi:hypothetical protein